MVNGGFKIGLPRTAEISSVALAHSPCPHYPIHVQKPLEIIDPTLLQVARRTYRDYCRILEGERERFSLPYKRPLGVAVNQQSDRAVLVFQKRPVLLPTEVFVPFNQLQTELY